MGSRGLGLWPTRDDGPFRPSRVRCSARDSFLLKNWLSPLLRRTRFPRGGGGATRTLGCRLRVATPRRRAWCVRRQVAGTGKTAGRAEVASGMRAPTVAEPRTDPPRRAIGPAAGADDSMTENEQSPVAGKAPPFPLQRSPPTALPRPRTSQPSNPPLGAPSPARRRTPAARRHGRRGGVASRPGGPGQPAGSAQAASSQRGGTETRRGPPASVPAGEDDRRRRGECRVRAGAGLALPTPSAATCPASTSRCFAGSWSACTSSLVFS